MKSPYDFMDNSIITGKYEYIFLCISVLLGLVDHKILKFITENFGMQTRSPFLLMCDLKKKKKFKKEKKEESSKTGFGVGVGVAVGAGRPAPMWAQRHPYVSPLPLSNPFSSALLSVALLVALLLSTMRATFSSRSSALASLKPCHLYTTSFWCSSRRERAFQFLLCVRTVPVYSALAPGKFVVFFVALCSEL